MSKLDDFRAQNPNYADRSDAELLDAIYNKFYSGKIGRQEFETGMGVAPTSTLGEAGQAADDMARIVADTATRGFADKTLGTEDQALTRAARDRAGWAALPTDIGAAIATSPYKVGSALVGAGAGAVEGALDAYGHQKDWIPDWQGVKDIGTGAATSAVLGSGMVGLTKGLQNRWAEYQGKKRQTFPTDEALEEGAFKSMREDPFSLRSQDLMARSGRVEAARAAQGEGRGAFAKLLSGVPAEDAAAKAIAEGGPGKTKQAVQAAGTAAEVVGKKYSAPAIIAETIASGGVPWYTLSGMGAKAAASKAGRSEWAKGDPAKEVERYIAIIRDPKGQGITDPADIAAARDALAKMGITAGKGFER